MTATNFPSGDDPTEARIIAAAPDLLAAAEAFFQPERVSFFELRDLLKAAISKAKGSD